MRVFLFVGSPLSHPTLSLYQIMTLTRCMRTWITSIGISHHAVVNTFWASAAEKDWIPQRVYLLTNDRTKKDAVAISTRMERIAIHYGGEKLDLRLKVFDETDLEALFQMYSDIMNRETQEGNDISVDITPGRKFMSAFALYCSLNNRSCVRNIFYFHLLDDEFMDRSYPFLPMNSFKLRNLMDFREAIP